MSDFFDPRLGGRAGRPGFGGGFGRDRRGPNRVRRGDVQAAVLALLAEADMHGYQIIQELAERSGGVWRPGAGSIYPTLRALQEQGLIRSRSEGSKRVFSITDYGRRSAAATDSPAPWQEYVRTEGPRVQLRQGVESLLSALSQVESVGTEAQLGRAAALVNDARKALYLMLAEEDS